MATLNPFDVQSRHVVSEDGTAEALYAGCGVRGGQQYVLQHRKRSGDANEAARTSNDFELYARSTNSFSEKGK